MREEKKHKLGACCIICDKEKELGFYLYDSYICLECEKAMVQTNADEPAYKFYVNQLKKVKTPKVIS